MAAAIPPCAQVEDAPSPSGFGVRTVTGSGASCRAVKRPAKPPPMTSTRCGPPRRWNFKGLAMAVPLMELPHSNELSANAAPHPECAASQQRSPAASSCQVHHSFHCHACPRCDLWIHLDLLFHKDKAIQDFRKRNPFHIWAQIARPRELGFGRLDCDIVGHRALSDENDTPRLMIFHPLDHAIRRAGIVRLLDDIRRAFGVRDNFYARFAVAVAAQLFAGEALMNLATPFPG